MTEPIDAPHLVAVLGATASGKTALAEALAHRLDAQLINADAFQVYRGLDIGTAKPEHKNRYLLLDLKEPDEAFGVGEWVKLAREALGTLWNQRRSAVLVGGTGLYVRALTEHYEQMSAPPDPELRNALVEREKQEGLEALAEELRARAPDLAASVDLRNPVRVRRALERLEQHTPEPAQPLPGFKQTKLAINVAPEVLNKRIRERICAMVESGWLDEVRLLRYRGVTKDAPGMRAIGYRVLFEHLEGAITLDEALEEIVLRTRQYAKRQRTWLRREPRLQWLTPRDGQETVDEALNLIYR